MHLNTPAAQESSTSRPGTRKTISALYVILDAATLEARSLDLREVADSVRAAGVRVVQYRHKDGSPQTILKAAQVLCEVFAGQETTLIVNDRADLAVLAGFDGVHVGQGDLAPEDVRLVTGASRRLIVGVSTHDAAETAAADASTADYVAIGPVYATGSKRDASPVVGLDGVRRARAMTRKPVVAIGGITRANAAAVIDAGAGAIAVISGLYVQGESIEKVARDFLDFFR